MFGGEKQETLPCLEMLEQTPIIIEKILYGAGHEHLHWKPALDRWTISEVLAHMLAMEKIFIERAHKMVEEKDPPLAAYDQNAAYKAGDYSSGKARDHLRAFCHERDRGVTWLRYLPAAAAERTGQHAELGRITLGQLLHEWAFHDLGHIRQITELYRARAFYPKMGAFQRYYTLNP